MVKFFSQIISRLHCYNLFLRYLKATHSNKFQITLSITTRIYPCNNMGFKLVLTAGV